MSCPHSSYKRRWLAVAMSGVLLAAVGSTTAWAQEAADANEPTVLEAGGFISPEAQIVLDRMTATLQTMKRYSVKTEITRDEVLNFGYKLQNVESAQIWVDAPQHLRTEVTGDIKNRTYIYDGKQITVVAPDQNVYSSGAAPGTIGELVGSLLDLGVEMPIIDMLYQGFTGNLTDNVRVGILVGESDVEGVPTDHLAFRQADVDWQLWVEKGEKALPRKLLITTRYAVGDPQYGAIMHWDLAPVFTDKTFVYEPPKDAVKIPFGSELVATGGAP